MEVCCVNDNNGVGAGWSKRYDVMERGFKRRRAPVLAECTHRSGADLMKDRSCQEHSKRPSHLSWAPTWGTRRSNIRNPARFSEAFLGLADFTGILKILKILGVVLIKCYLSLHHVVAFSTFRGLLVSDTPGPRYPTVTKLRLL